MTRFAAQIAFLARTEPPRWLSAGEREPAAAAAIVDQLRLLIPLAGLIDLDAERKRLDKERARVLAEIDKCNAKLARDSFVASAPAAVVDQERRRRAEFTQLLTGLDEQIAKLA